MPHDYEFWQKQRRTSSAQYRFFSTTFAVPSQAGLRGYITVKAPGPSRTARSAYWIQRIHEADTEVASDPLPEELRNSIIPDRAPGARRSAPSVYWRSNQLQIADEITGMRISELPDRAPGRRRATNDQYWRRNQAQIGDEVAGMPVWSIPDRALGARRSAPSVYWRDNQPQIGDEVLGMPVTSIPNVARGPQRTAHTQYLLALLPQIKDEVEGMRVREMPDIARGPARTANIAYLVNASFVIADAVIELEEFRKLAITDFARGARRAPNTEYLIRQTPQIGDEVTGMPVWSIPDRALGARRAADYLINLKPAIADEILGMRISEITDFARGPQRTANTAYWYDNNRAAIIDTAASFPEELGQAITEHAKGFARAANPDYWIATWPVPPDVILSGGRGYVTTFAKGAQRADRTAYDQPKKSVIIDDVIIPDFEEIRRTIIPDRAPGKLRAANTDYWLWTPFTSPDGTLFVSLESFNMPQRAAASAYWRNGMYVVPDVVESAEIHRTLMPSRADAKARAANSAYWRDDQFGLPDDALIMLARSITDSAPGAKRGANTIYLVNARFADDLNAFNSEIQQAITQMARGPQRAANTVYWAWAGQGTVIIDDSVGPDRRPMRTKNWHRNR